MPSPMPSMSRATLYRLGNQIGFILRQASQHYAALFVSGTDSDPIPTRWVILVRPSETGLYPQGQLGRFTIMNAAIIKGVVECLDKRGPIQHSADPDDSRHPLVSLSPAGRTELEAGLTTTREVNRQALAPLFPQKQGTLHGLSTRLV